MGFIVWLIVGGIVGWLASIIMKTNEQQGIVLNVAVGIAGSFLAGLVGARSNQRG
ncbi:MAG: GlsB/YeaQ/YmgE family stress response membrane protein, partial [Myxococcota bacterium]